MKMSLSTRRVRALFAATAAATLAACGGGGDSSAPAAAPTPAPPAAAAAIDGFAATGRALPTGTPVRARCVVGTAEGTTTATGAFSLPADTLTFPCLLQATYGTGESQRALYSLATAAGTVQITSLTHASVAQGLGADLAGTFTSPTAATLGALVTQLPTVQTRLRQVLTDNGLATALAPVPGDFFTSALRPATSTTTGDAHDLLLDAVAARFGMVDALLSVLREAIAGTDPGVAARVDWRYCASAPRQETLDDGRTVYTGSECDSRAVVLSKDPYVYTQRGRKLPGVIDMTLASDAPQLSGAVCGLTLQTSAISPQDLPGWAGSNAVYVRGWDISLVTSTGMGIGGVGGGGAFNGSSNGAVQGLGTVVADSAVSGATVIRFSTNGGRGEVDFVGSFLRSVSIAPSGACRWSS